MGFRENLKDELLFAGMKVKDLAVLSGVKKQTLDSYLRESSNTPSVENAVRIAKALDVTVEYLVTGTDSRSDSGLASLHPDTRILLKTLDTLPPESRRTVIRTALFLAEALTGK
jgi:transcriptional regulator with XRE-family HTH domain